MTTTANLPKNALTQKQIAARYKRAKQKLTLASADIAVIQGICRHPASTARYESDTGNYDPSQDSHWLWCNCPDCGKLWSIDSEDDEYRFFPRDRIVKNG